MRAPFIVLVIGLLAFSLAAEIKVSKPSRYQGMCDASGAAAIDSTMFAVANDEDSQIRIYKNDRGGLPFKTVNLNRFLELDPIHPETDLEGAARIGDVIYWIGSHGRSHDGRERLGRHRLFGTTIKLTQGDVEIRPVGKAYMNLLEDLIHEPKFRSLNFAAASRLAPKLPNALNIEGLSATPNEQLLIGFRNPLHNGRALAIPLLNPNEVLNGKPSKFGESIELDLGGLGIRDMAYTGREYLIIGGHFDGHGHSRLFRWAGGANPPQPIEVKHFKHYNPEAIIIYPGKGEKIQILSDDGNSLKQGKRCKDLKDPTAQSFRSFWIKL